MFKIREIHIENYKNLSSVHLNFSSRFICFTGENGAGKTNMLDTIYYTSMGKSYFSGNDARNIQEGKLYFNLRQVNDINGEITEVFVALANGSKKRIRANQKDYEKISDHIGRFPLVMVTPYDIELIDNGSTERRKFLDRLISQTDQNYLNLILQYNRALQQRNALLRWMNEKGSRNVKLLQAYNQVIIKTSSPIFLIRKQYIEDLNELASEFYAGIGNKKEEISLSYVSVLNEKSAENILTEMEEDDISAGRTITGIHRDDINIRLNGKEATSFASQGQKKSILLAVKLAEYILIKNHKNFRPVLLLDDLMDKLDEKRFQNLLHLITNDDFGQVFITDTSYERMKNMLDAVTADYSFFEVNEGNIQLKPIFETS
ncbi:MAG TPA: DNA replication and repair protein RecF [Bacteroidia bacterium]|nr:DNA replication and repair protein RecF [Bacteroidia bacterium]HRS58374.1 DNA replication and repair protein RecF [Bacteroidia bacterium]HRU67324.1 DNA replication and repair protein RecF [Bacteroidia bacterium]